MTELRARLHATSTAFQTRENSVAELREAVHDLRLDLLAGQQKTKAQARKLEEQVMAVLCSYNTSKYWYCSAGVGVAGVPVARAVVDHLTL